MKRKKKLPTLAGRVIAAWMVALILSTVSVGVISFNIHKAKSIEARGIEAQHLAFALAQRIDGDQLADMMLTLEPTEHWYEVKEYVDTLATEYETEYLYVVSSKISNEVVYFVEGSASDDAFGLGMTDDTNAYAPEMLEAVKTGRSLKTGEYLSEGYGYMVSGFAPVFDSRGNVVGVVGFDFALEDILTDINRVGLILAVIVVAFVLVLYLIMSHLGIKAAGKPLDTLDKAAQQLATGDMDIHLNIRSKSEIGRLSNSLMRMVDGMKEQIKALEALANGDLTVEIQPRSSKDNMGKAIVQIIENLNGMFYEIKTSATQVSTGAKQISDSANSLAQGSSEQSAAVEELSTSISDVTEQANTNLSATVKTKTLADTINAEAQIGSEHMERMTQAVKEIMEASVSINKVIKVIDDIAFQTNILALNAAVEAARAGQHGKGFAVVAEEVRNLAAKSADAAKDTNNLITNSMVKAQLGASIAGETSASLSKIMQGINECAVLVNGIATAFDTQILAMRQVSSSIEQVSKVVQQNSAAAEESAAASQEMSGQSASLHEMIGRFKVKDSTLYLGE